jgi:peptidoglycan-associated lipoprotein
MTRSVAIAGAILALVVAGCAKQPNTTQASAPAPGSATAGTIGGPGSGPSGSGTAGDAARGAGAGLGAGGATGGATAGAMRPPVKEFRPTADLADIYFDFDRAEIRESDAKVLDANATWLKRHPDHLVLIEGHCDERGTNEYNTALGDRRAKATMNYLASRGVAMSRMTVISYGEERPACTQRTDECWAKNRRAHFLVKAK